MLSTPSTLHEIFYSFSFHDNLVLGVVACLIGEKSEVYKDLITFSISPDFGSSSAWANEPLFHEAGRLRILEFQISGIISFFKDVINTTQREAEA